MLAVLALLAAALLVQALAAGPAPRPPAAAPGGVRRRWPVAACFGLFAAYTAALPWLGFRLGTALFVAAAQLMLGPRTRRSVPGALLAGAATALLTWVVFERYLHVLLPRGVWVP